MGFRERMSEWLERKGKLKGNPHDPWHGLEYPKSRAISSVGAPEMLAQAKEERRLAYGAPVRHKKLGNLLMKKKGT